MCLCLINVCLINVCLILFTYFPKLLKLRFLTQYIHHFQHSNRIRTVFVNKNYYYYLCIYLINLFIYLFIIFSLFLSLFSLVVLYAHESYMK